MARDFTIPPTLPAGCECNSLELACIMAKSFHFNGDYCHQSNNWLRCTSHFYLTHFN